MSAELHKKQIFKRLRLGIQGVVQGVGFRPFVYVTAKKFELTGFVGNESMGVCRSRGRSGKLTELPKLFTRESSASRSYQ